MKIRCLVIDDEYMARLLLENYIQKLPQLELVSLCENAIEAMSMLQKEKIEVIFLDIQMSHLTGLEFLHTLQQKPVVIFTTAYSEYALEGFRLDAVDYLLKPFSFERFVQAVNKAAHYLSFQANNKESASTPIESNETRQLFVKSDGKLVKVRFDEILYIEGLKEYVSIYTPHNRIITLQSLRNLETLLPRSTFLRVHKSYIIALDKIQAIVGNQVEIHKKLIPIGATYKEILMNALQLEE
ncbi:LytTR family DNA-binding domain-containing protein [Emticicia sp. BO119]|uniref:LytR/AlgR family response regulator transcription factor n=1 Tax=Emticicia sp. BO119 TaxID=2757768 RepID=UPI0015F0A77C|nr:LytTR family DNA-binding domain-containing protein [Emticicia sp. BO119]MBA4851260.1 response regulator transcription factor [Emticicia sp. BO119]